LGALTFCFYGITIISNKLCDDSLSLGINKLLQKSKKIVLFENQDEIAIRAYTKYTEAVSSFIFALIGIILLSILYIDAGIAITLTITFTLLIFITFSNLNILFKNKSLDDIQNNIRKFSDISFMLTFVFIVLDFLYFTPPKFIIAIIAIILSRVLLARLFITINHLLSLNKQKEKINTLFFQNHHISSKQNDTKNSVWDLLELHSRHEWITELLKQISINATSEIDIKWNETNLQNIVVITVNIPQENRQLLIKLFDKSATMSALHQATLLIEFSQELPSPPLVIISKIQNYHCHVFDISGMEFAKPENIKEIKNKLVEKLLGFALSDEFNDRYTRSKQMPWQTVNNELFERLKLVASERELEQLSKVEENLSSFIKMLKALPIVIDLPINEQFILLDKNNTPLLADWGKWTLTPLGTNFNSLDISKYESNQTSIDNYKQAVLLQKLILNYKKQKYQYINTVIIPELYIGIITDAYPSPTKSH